MNERDLNAFTDLLMSVGELYNRKLSPSLVSIYWEALKHLDFNAVADALNRHAMNPDTGQFMPKPADVIRMMQGTTVDSAMQAWSKVDKAVRQVGPYQTVVFDDPAIHRVIDDMGGWVQLGAKTDDEWPFVQREFEVRYKGYAIRGGGFEFPRSLTGIADTYNLPRGYAAQEPLLIGQPERAQQVLLKGTTGGIQISSVGQIAQRIGHAN